MALDGGRCCLGGCESGSDHLGSPAWPWPPPAWQFLENGPRNIGDRSRAARRSRPASQTSGGKRACHHRPSRGYRARAACCSGRDRARAPRCSGRDRASPHTTISAD
jgi:hypothetical protein